MSDFEVRIIETEEPVINLELVDPLSPDINLEVTSSDVQVINLEIVNNDKIVLSDLPDIGAGNIIGLLSYVQNVIGASGVVGGSGIATSYDEGTGLTTLSNSITNGSGIALSYDSGSNTFTIGIDDHTHTTSQITNFISGVNTIVSGVYAPLNSPALTGIPTAPTASTGVYTSQIATTLYVHNEIENLIGSAPEVLDTLKELADALGNDPDFIGTITTSINEKASLSGAIFTGDISAPTGYFETIYGSGQNITNLDASNISSGTIGLSFLPTGIPVTNLAESGITLGSTTINLGETSSVIDGLTRISGDVSSLYMYNVVLDGGSP